MWCEQHAVSQKAFQGGPERRSGQEKKSFWGMACSSWACAHGLVSYLQRACTKYPGNILTLTRSIRCGKKFLKSPNLGYYIFNRLFHLIISYHIKL